MADVTVNSLGSALWDCCETMWQATVLPGRAAWITGTYAEVASATRNVHLDPLVEEVRQRDGVPGATANNVQETPKYLELIETL